MGEPERSDVEFAVLVEEVFCSAHSVIPASLLGKALEVSGAGAEEMPPLHIVFVLFSDKLVL